MADEIRWVVIVDDEKSIVSMATQMITGLGFLNVRGFQVPGDALEAMKGGTKPILLLTDVRMPGMTGVELATEANKLFHGLPVIFMTGNDSGLGEEIARLGARLDKPFFTEDLTAALEKIGLL